MCYFPAFVARILVWHVWQRPYKCPPQHTCCVDLRVGEAGLRGLGRPTTVHQGHVPCMRCGTRCCPTRVMCHVCAVGRGGVLPRSCAMYALCARDRLMSDLASLAAASGCRASQGDVEHGTSAPSCHICRPERSTASRTAYIVLNIAGMWAMECSLPPWRFIIATHSEILRTSCRPPVGAALLLSSVELRREILTARRHARCVMGRPARHGWSCVTTTPAAPCYDMTREQRGAPCGVSVQPARGVHMLQVF